MMGVLVLLFLAGQSAQEAPLLPAGNPAPLPGLLLWGDPRWKARALTGLVYQVPLTLGGILFSGLGWNAVTFCRMRSPL